MIIKVEGDIFMRVEDDSQGESACSSLESGLPTLINQSGFPDGEVITLKIKMFSEATDEEVEEHELDLE